MDDIKYLGVQGLEELIILAQNSIAKKADVMQFDVMPDPIKYIGKVVQYVGVSDVVFTRSHFYYSNGVKWTEENISGGQTTQIEMVTVLPTWANADPQILYILKDTTDKKMGLYVKNPSVNDSWFTVETSGSFAVVATLPQWADADPSTIYFKADGNILTGYIKKTGTIGAWYTLGGASQDTIDTALSASSTNPVQNKVVYAAIQDVLAKVVNVYHFKGSCLTADLPSEGNSVGDTWNLEDASNYGPAGTNVAWTGTEWDALSGGDMNYMRGLHDPDWSGIIVYNNRGFNGEHTFTCPKRGFFNIISDCSAITVAINDKYFEEGLLYYGCSLPVNKGDNITFSYMGTPNTFTDLRYRFVPYKVQ